MTMTAIGAPDPEGTSFALGPAMLEVTGGGLHFPIASGASDQFQFVHRAVTGDFDAQVRVVSMVGDGRFESASQAILAARESADEFSAEVSVTVTPPAPGDDVIKAMVRLVANDITNNVGDPFVPNGLPNNAWMRITRAGDQFTAYRSTNGTEWVELGNVRVTLPPALQVGVGAVSHRNTHTMTATFSDLQINAGESAPPDIRLVNLSYQGGAFSASFQSQNSLTYTPQYKDSVSAGVWTPLPSITGDGTVKTFTDSGVPSTGYRFYRVSQP